MPPPSCKGLLRRLRWTNDLVLPNASASTSPSTAVSLLLERSRLVTTAKFGKGRRLDAIAAQQVRGSLHDLETAAVLMTTLYPFHMRKQLA